MAASLNRFLLAGGLLCLALPALALEIELLSDPTRPAIGMPSAADAGGGAGSAIQPVHQGLQSVIISPQRRAAVIDGATVELGGKVGDATLIDVRESSVVLQGAQGRRVMELFPGVRINKVETAAPLAEKTPAQKHRKAAGSKKNKNASEPTSSGQNNKDERDSK